MTDETNKPRSILDVTLADVLKENTREGARDSVAGVGADAIQIRGLATEVEVLEAKQAALQAEGRSLNRAEAATLDSRRKSLAFQEARYAEQQALTPGMERRDSIALQMENSSLAQTQMLDAR